ncbi:MAG: hypothetical protein BGO67_04885 [Alphaproteobacteria bacterium 41-28]|nr:MAG: hypothetical protein BGO67_04885 [Alphaproteobacteria bacterium 41-28]
MKLVGIISAVQIVLFLSLNLGRADTANPCMNCLERCGANANNCAIKNCCGVNQPCYGHQSALLKQICGG